MPERFPAIHYAPFATLILMGVWLAAALLITGMVVRLTQCLADPNRQGSVGWWLAAIPATIVAWVGLFVALLGGLDVSGHVIPVEMTAEIVGVFGAASVLVSALGLTGAWIVYRQRRPSPPRWVVVETIPVWIVAALLVSVPFKVVFAREDARSAVCRGRLKGIVLAFHNDLDNRGRFTPTAAEDHPVSWRVRLLPYLDERRLSEQYDPTQAWNHAANAKVARSVMPVYHCPTVNPAGMAYPQTSYVAVTGEHAALGPFQSRDLASFPDGTSHTILVAEACGLEIPWAEPRDYVLGRDPVGVNLAGARRKSSPGALSSSHHKHVNVAMADGAVRVLSENIDPKVLEALLTADGGETIPDE